MKLTLITMILCFSLLSCRDPICYINISEDDFIKAIDAGEDCNSVAYCADGEIDKSILKACLEEKKKRSNKSK